MALDTEAPYFHYTQLTGELDLEETSQATWLGNGYSGKGKHRNNPMSSAIIGWGPIPKGWYTLEGPFNKYVNDQGHRLGNCVFRLVPDKDNQMFKRSGFLIHGDNKNHDASEGCIVQGPSVREHVAAIFRQGVKRLKVT